MDSDSYVVPAVGCLAIVLMFGSLAGLSLWQLVRIARLRRTGTRVPGRVVSFESVRGGNRWLRISFRTVEGQGVGTRFKVMNPQLTPGQDVTVAYDPAKPESVAVLDASPQIRLHVWRLAVATFGLTVFGWAGYQVARILLA